MTGDVGPFETQVEEVHLDDAPLVRVLSQVRWPQVTQLQSDLDPVARAMGRLLAEAYPLYAQVRELQVALTPEGATQQSGGVSHQFRSSDESWTVTLAQSFVTLETNAYTSRKDFCEKFHYVLDALASVVQIPFAQRVGFRYVNRIDDPDIYNQLPDLVRSEFLGTGGVDSEKLVHSLNEAVYQVSQARLLARWAQLPPGATFDPTMEASDKRSWMLDLDAFIEDRAEFKADPLATSVAELSVVAYKFFRWAVTDEFIKVHGGIL